MILLKEYPVMDNTQGVADYAETVAKAQLKKVAEWLVERDTGYVVHSSYPELAGRGIVIGPEDRQALLKEIK